MQEFDVGSYVWFVRADKPAVYHYLIIEEIVKKSISGITRDYLFEVKSGKKTGRIQSKDLDGDYFLEREDAYNFMLNQAGIAINKMMDKAQYLDDKPVSPSTLNLEQDNQEENETIVELPDGTKARLKGGLPK